jgi:hypothetical protein
LVSALSDRGAEMNEDPWYRRMSRNNPTMLLRGIAVILLILYVSLLVGARFA